MAFPAFALPQISILCCSSSKKRYFAFLKQNQMKLKALALMGVICASVAFTSCKKDDDDKNEGTPSSSIEGTWKTTAFTITGTDTTIDLYADMDACEKDNLLRFNADKTVTQLSGATKCDPSDPSSEDGGPWSMSSDNKKLTTTDGVYDVITLDDTTVKLQMKGQDSGGSYTLKVTMARQ
jgi:hypothetical protein